MRNRVSVPHSLPIRVWRDERLARPPVISWRLIKRAAKNPLFLDHRALDDSPGQPGGDVRNLNRIRVERVDHRHIGDLRPELVVLAQVVEEVGLLFMGSLATIDYEIEVASPRSPSDVRLMQSANPRGTTPLWTSGLQGRFPGTPSHFSPRGTRVRSVPRERPQEGG
jgi:hypothetical protein